jgi:hypothetical protein
MTNKTIKTAVKAIEKEKGSMHAPSFPFVIDENANPNFPISGRHLLEESGEVWSLEDWSEKVIKKMSLSQSDYCRCPESIFADMEDICFTVYTAIAIGASFENKFGYSCRNAVETIYHSDKYSENSQGPSNFKEMFAELESLERASLRARVGSTRYFEIAEAYQARYLELLPTAMTIDLDSYFTREIADQAIEKLCIFCAAERNQMRKINAALEEIYSSDLYAEAVEKGLAPQWGK